MPPNFQINWDLYQEDIDSWYVNGHFSVDETIAKIREKYHVKITPRQFKYKFKGLRNLKSKEWLAVISEIWRREAVGKDSDVYFHNRKLEPSRVSEAIQKYGKLLKNGNPKSSFDRINDGIIRIQTPPLTAHRGKDIVEDDNDIEMITQDDERENSAFTVRRNTLSTSQFNTTTDGIVSLDSPPRPTMSLAAYTEFDTLDVLDLGTPDIDRDSHQYLPNFLRGDNFAISIPTQHHPSFSIRGLQALPVASTLRKLQSFWNSPATRRVFPALNDTGMEMEAYDTFDVKVSTCRAKGLSNVALNPTRADILGPATRFFEEIISKGRHTPMYHDFFWPERSLSDLLTPIWTIMTYLASNNRIDTAHIISFIEWVNETQCLDSLIQYFQETPENVCENQSLVAKCIAALHTPQFRPGIAPDNSPIFDHSSIFLRPLLERASKIGLDTPSLGTEISSRYLDMVLPSLNFQMGMLVESGAGKSPPMPRPVAASTIYSLSACNGCLGHSRYIGHDLLHAFSHQDTEKLKGFLPFLAPHTLRREHWVKARNQHPEGYQLLLEHAATAYNCSIDFLEAAEMGTSALEKFGFDRGIIEDGIIFERGLCLAVVTGSMTAVQTLLEQGTDPNATKYRQSVQATYLNAEKDLEAAQDHTCDDNLSNPIVLALHSRTHQHSDHQCINSYLFHLLVQAGVKLDTKSLGTIGKTDDPEFWIYLAQMGYDTRALGIPGLARFGFDISLLECATLLEIGASLDSYGVNSLNRLQDAAETGDHIMVQYLLSRGAAVNYPAHPDGGLTALQAAVRHGGEKLVKCLLDAGADFRAPPAKADGRTVLEATVEGSRPFMQSGSLFKKMLELGAPFNRPQGQTGSLLHRLILKNEEDWVEILKLMLQMGAKLDDRVGRQTLGSYRLDIEVGLHPKALLTPLQLAALVFNRKSILALVEKGAQVNEPPAGVQGATALQYAAFYGGEHLRNDQLVDQIETLKLLLDRGSAINAPPGNDFGRTALQAAVLAADRNFVIVELLLSNGADVNAPPATRGGVTAIQAAAIRGNIELALLLLQWGADINAAAAPEEGRTAIEGAAEHGQLEMVRFLLIKGAIPDPVNGFRRAIEFAREHGNPAIAEILQESQDAFNPFTMSYDY